MPIALCIYRSYLWDTEILKQLFFWLVSILYEILTHVYIEIYTTTVGTTEKQKPEGLSIVPIVVWTL